MKHANVSIFVPHAGCPHQCSFCNQREITGQTGPPSPDEVERSIQVALRNRASFGVAEIAFFGGSFTAMDPTLMESLLQTAYPYVQNGSFSGIRISTRPDAIDLSVLSVLKTYGVTSIELGAQSMSNQVLSLNGRGHTAQDVQKASQQIQESGFSLGLQMMTGLYGSSPDLDWETAKQLAALCPDTVRIYPTVVLAHTRLAELLSQGAYRPPDLEQTVILCARLLALFGENGIRVIRLGLHSASGIERERLAGPYHPAFGELCYSRLFLNQIISYLQKNKIPSGKVTVLVSPADLSKALGQHRKNAKTLLALGWQVCFSPSDSVPKGRFHVVL